MIRLRERHPKFQNGQHNNGYHRNGESLRVLSPEQASLEKLKAHSEVIIQEAEQLLQTQYPSSEYPFHNLDHAKQIGKDTAALLAEIRTIDPDLVTEADIIFAEVEGMRHDIPQDREQFGDQDYDPRFLKIVRKRGFDPEQVDIADRPENFVSGNEQAAADQLIAIIRQERYGDTFNQFTDEAIQLDIGTTYPKERFDMLPDEYLPDHLKGLPIFTMMQPFARVAGIRGVCLALADLKEPAGRVTNEQAPAERAIRAGNSEFRELYVGITRQLREAPQNEQGHVLLEPDIQADFVGTMVNWKQAQEGFYRGQQYDFDGILDENPAINASPHAEEIKAMLRDRYSGFETIAQGLRQEYIEVLEQTGLMYEVDGQTLPLREAIINAERRYNIVASAVEELIVQEETSQLSEAQVRQLDELQQSKQAHHTHLDQLKALEREKIKAVTPEQFAFLLKKFGY